MRDRPEAAALGRAFWLIGDRRFVNMDLVIAEQRRAKRSAVRRSPLFLLLRLARERVDAIGEDSQYPSKYRDGANLHYPLAATFCRAS